MTLFTWSQTASSNNTADSTINYREGQAPSTINNSARAAMAAVAKYRDDISGKLNTGGSSTAYTITSNQTYTSLSDGIVIVARLHAANGAAPTLNVDSLGAKAIRTHTSTAITSGSMNSGGIYEFTYDSGDDCWYVRSFYTVTTTTFADNAFRVQDNGDATKQLAFEVSGLTTATTRTLTIQDADGTVLIDDNIGVTVQGYDADTLKADTADDLTAGFTSTSKDQGTKSSGTFTPVFATGTVQHCVNGGAFTLGVPTGNGTMTLDITNNASAGAITTSSWTLVTGDAFTTTNTDTFRCYISVGDVGSHLQVVAF